MKFIDPNHRVNEITNIFTRLTKDDNIKDIFDACASQVSGCIAQGCGGDLKEADRMIETFTKALKETVRITLEIWEKEDEQKGLQKQN